MISNDNNKIIYKDKLKLNCNKSEGKNIDYKINTEV